MRYIRAWLERYRVRLSDDREYISGRYHVTLERLLVRSEVTVWKDVRPAAGGLISRKVLPDAEAECVYEAAVRVLADHA